MGSLSRRSSWGEGWLPPGAAQALAMTPNPNTPPMLTLPLVQDLQKARASQITPSLLLIKLPK